MIPQSLPESVDVIVVGARCAGAATARLLAARGARVLLVDRAPGGTDTLSTHALMRGAVVQLSRWGLLPRLVALGTPAVRHTTFDYGGESIRIEITPKYGTDALFAPRRTVLDGLLQESALEAGAVLRYGCRLVRLDTDADGRVTGAHLEDASGVRAVRAGMVVGADGRHSSVARQVGAVRQREARAVTGSVYGHWPGLDADGYRWLYSQSASAGVIPTNDGAACVFATVPAYQFAATFAGDVAGGFARVLRSLDPALEEATRRTAPLAGLHGFGGQVGSFTACQGPGWALVGDAAYFKDPLTAHGITDALLHAELLATAIAAGTPERMAWYERTRTAMAAEVFELTDAISSFDWTWDELRALHVRLARAMSAEVVAALAAFGHAAGDLAIPPLHDDQPRVGARRIGLGDHEQQPAAVR
ncbi:MAG: FAD-dependent monooxygenase [Vicinamibacterales bacterium]